eukprot:CAMPEP_0205858918 /NCGR_PEP_ID=MMETSP1083-20121108/4456_1 /ASSEMBLY_ACC=CAM_ASM_000430 /TAXON_ID=97485 /ORGANISM="Prymnesium parvum, Strain Texoma1" /LENGTH=242 /DNA_ID=CAMNT_0053220515 /DNA_START=512 /DNA_END=1241 /DNA_ORIENTATION=+
MQHLRHGYREGAHVIGDAGRLPARQTKQVLSGAASSALGSAKRHRVACNALDAEALTPHALPGRAPSLARHLAPVADGARALAKLLRERDALEAQPRAADARAHLKHAVFDERQCWHACFMVRLVLPSGSAAPEVRSSRPVVQLSPGAVAPQSAALPSAEMAIRGTPCCADSSRAVPHSSKVELRLSSRMQCAVAQLSALRTARSSRKPPSAEAGASRASANGIRSSCSLETTVEVAEESSL